MQSLHGSKPDVAPVLSGGSEVDLQSLTKKLFQIEHHSQRKFFISPQRISLCIQTTHIGKPTQNELNGIREGFVVCLFVSVCVCFESHDTIGHTCPKGKLSVDPFLSFSLS